MVNSAYKLAISIDDGVYRLASKTNLNEFVGTVMADLVVYCQSCGDLSADDFAGKSPKDCKPMTTDIINKHLLQHHYATTIG